MNNEKLIKKMHEAIRDCNARVHSDFIDFDKRIVESSTPEQFPMLWLIGNNCTTLIKPRLAREDFFNNPRTRQLYINGEDMVSLYFNNEIYDYRQVYLIKRNGIEEITIRQAIEIIRTEEAKAVNDWEECYGPLGAPTPIALSLANMTEEDMEKLLIDCDEHDDTSLVNIIRRLTNPRRRVCEKQCIRLSYDKEMQKITVREVRDGEVDFYGMIVFHGWPETGFKHNGSFQLDPQYGWELHT